MFLFTLPLFLAHFTHLPATPSPLPSFYRLFEPALCTLLVKPTFSSLCKLFPIVSIPCEPPPNTMEMFLTPLSSPSSPPLNLVKILPLWPLDEFSPFSSPLSTYVSCPPSLSYLAQYCTDSSLMCVLSLHPHTSSSFSDVSLLNPSLSGRVEQ